MDTHSSDPLAEPAENARGTAESGEKSSPADAATIAL
jgi:hypothetical protein